jgi:hypothetical protein
MRSKVERHSEKAEKEVRRQLIAGLGTCTTGGKSSGPQLERVARITLLLSRALVY